MPLKGITIAAVLIWTAVAVAVCGGEIANNRTFLEANAKAIARASFEKDIAFRRWAAKHGGVYVPVTLETLPNPYLNLPERDITTASGRALTLMNPAYMTRQIHELMQATPGAPKGHITSLNPIRPENVPDEWERQALTSFENGTAEYSGFQDVDGRQHFRFMRALNTEKPCLKCHASQGYREGDVRGGISVSLDVSELSRIIQASNKSHLIVVAVIWFIGLAGILASYRAIGKGARSIRESEERYRQQFQQSRAVMIIIDPQNGSIIDANEAACSYYGYGCDVLKSMTISEINTSSPAELARCIAGVQDGSKRQFFAQHRRADGSVRDVEVFSNPVSFGNTELLHSIIFDVSARKAAERELRDKMYFAENLVLNSTTPTFVISADHQVLIWNRSLEELTGVKAHEVVGTREHWQAFYPSPRPCLADIVLAENPEIGKDLYTRCSPSRLIPGGLHAEGDYTFENRRCRLIFSAAPIHDRGGRVIAAIETLEDITERISLETRLFQAQKMESVGELAGGIAHDFNNVLTVISGYADLLKLTLKDDENVAYAGEISSSVERAADMTRSLLAFSGKQEVVLQYDDLNQILANIRKSLGRLIREDITLTIEPGEVRLPVYVDRVQIDQLLINLVVNARDALGSGGVITVSTRLVELEERMLEGNTVVPPGRYGCLMIADTGCGIDPVNLEQIFEPFFTTKERGKGTGLGLSIVHSIVVKHNGLISVVSSPGSGSKFSVYFPLYNNESSYRQAESIREITCQGTETVLIVEDDEAIMNLHLEILRRYGYSPLAAADGVTGLEQFDASSDRIQIVITDVIMPRMNGHELVKQIRSRRPDLPIIMTSGYTDDIIDRTAIDELRVHFIQKPVRPLALLADIRSCLDAKE